MCGFIGYIINHDTKREKQIEEKFNFYLKQLNNRGPDYSESKKIIHNDKIINFGFARLAIQDLSNNANKIFFNDKYILLFNGEIYNHNELRSKYFVNEKFETKTDTEVLFKLLTNYDFKKITELRGIFSIVFIKLGENKIYCLKDFTGTKPLYYIQNSEGFFFSSEAWFPYSVSEKRINPKSLRKYFSFGFVYGEDTLIENVRKVPPRTIINYDWNKNSYSRFEYLDISKVKDSNVPTTQDTKKTLEKIINNNLVTDTKVGTFLSGGVDSSTISLIAKKRSEILSFTSVYEPKKKYSKFNTDYDFTKKLCSDYNIDLQVTTINENTNILDDFYFVADYFDEPVSNFNFLNIYWQSKEASNSGVKVILTGDGSDEMFCGYERYKKTFIANKLFFLRFFSEKIKNLNPKDLDDLPKRFYEIYNDQKYKELMNDNFKNDVAQKIFNNEIFTNNLDYINYFDTKYWLADENNYKLDKCTMINSVEARVPFQDLDILNNYFYINNLKKISLLNNKFILKNMGILPKYVIKRKKQGWITPENVFINKNLERIISDLFGEIIIKKDGIFNFNILMKLFKLPLVEKYKFKRELMTIVLFQIWYNKVKSLK